MEITKEILESILDAYSYEVVFVDRQHIVRYMNKTAGFWQLCNFHTNIDMLKALIPYRFFEFFYCQILSF